jgi:ectoine hydroxylase-related dioxygenase (phytanoyl-CoA dioxygenase family)
MPFSNVSLDDLARKFNEEGYCVLPRHFERARIAAWRDAFEPLLQQHMQSEGKKKANRGNGRFYVTLPFERPWADPAIFENDDVLAVVERVAGSDPVMCQLASDTPVRGSDYQETHRDVPPLFPEWGRETPAFQIAVNFALCDITRENGPIEIARRTHLIPKAEAMAKVESGELPLEPVEMEMGDVMIRDVRALHRGTPNRTDVPRPMVVIGYSRRWLYRPEVSIQVPQSTWDTLSDRAKRLLRFNPRVEKLTRGEEIYQVFAY